MLPPLSIPIRRVRTSDPPLPLPAYQTPGSAGVDLLADVDSPVIVQPGARVLIPTGLAFAIPEGYEAQVRPRSGLALKHGLTIANAPGTIDSDFRGEVQVILIHLGTDPYSIERGARIAQMIFAPVQRVTFEETSKLEPTSRGDGGFGHTGS